MAPSTQQYEIVYMLRDGTTVSRWREKSPPAQALYFYRPVKSVFFTRHYPMFKVWRIYDLREFRVVPTNGSGGRQYQVVVVPPPSALLTDRDAAVMWMGLNLNA